MNTLKNNTLAVIFALMLSGCNQSEIVPVEIYPEDTCSQCRMAISDPRYAAEIITPEREVFKFDDIGCMEKYRERIVTQQLFIFVRDLEANRWLRMENSTIVRTGVVTPMGSGKLAFSSREKAEQFLIEHPVRTTGEEVRGGKK